MDMDCDRAAGEFYEIRIKGHLDASRSAWFDGLTITHAEKDETILAGPLADQAALWGVLAKVRDLGLGLIYVRRGKKGAYK